MNAPLLDVVQAWGIRVDYAAIRSAYYGSYSPDRKEIVLCTHDEQTFFHELAHAAHEQVLGALKRGQDWKQEIVAELTAATLMHLFGKRPNDGWSYRYISEYAEKAEKDVYRACLTVLADVETGGLSGGDPGGGPAEGGLLLRGNLPGAPAHQRPESPVTRIARGGPAPGPPLFSWCPVALCLNYVPTQLPPPGRTRCHPLASAYRKAAARPAKRKRWEIALG